MPTIGGGDDFVWIGGPDEGFWLRLWSATKRLMAPWRSTTPWKTPRLRRYFVMEGEETLDGVEPTGRWA